MKTDDDILVNTFKLLPFIKLKIANKYYPNNVIFCNVWYGKKPMRMLDSKWYISKVSAWNQ